MKDLSNIRNMKLVGKQTHLLTAFARILSDLNNDKITSKVEHHIGDFRDLIQPLSDLKKHNRFYLDLAYIHTKKL